MPPPEPSRRPVVRVLPYALGTVLAGVLALTLAACAPAGDADPSARQGVGDSVSAIAPPTPAGVDSTAVAEDTAVAASPGSPQAREVPRLAPLADTIAQRLVFVPLGQEWYAAAGRARRLLVDLGRLDIDLKKDHARLAAFRTAAAARSPVPVGTRFRLRGAWGSDDATVSGFDTWNGRIVATLEVSPLVDSIARATDPLVVSAQRVSAPDSAAPAACDRTPDRALLDRMAQLARLAEDSLRSSPDQPIYPRLKGALRARRSVAAGCFARWRGAVIVTLYAGDYEWVRERVLLVGDSTVQGAPVRDLRFRAHEALHALDADGDGVDDLAARAWTPRGGGTVILRLTDAGRFERLAAGFSWER